MDNSEQAVEFTVEDKEFILHLDTYTITRAPALSKEERSRLVPQIVQTRPERMEVLSPDGRWFAGLKEYNLWLRSTFDDRSVQMTTDGIEDYRWDGRLLWHRGPWAAWAPNSLKLAALKSDVRKARKIPIVHWLMPEPEVEWARGPGMVDLLVVDILSKRQVHVDTAQRIQIVGWSPDGSELVFWRTNTTFQTMDLIAANPETGATRVILTESREYFQGAKAHFGWRGTRSVHISRVYRGKSDDLYKFAITAPIWNNKEKFLGVIATSVTTDATVGLVHVTDPSRVWTFIAPKDIDSAELDPRSVLGKYVILFHPAYRRGVPAVEFPDEGMIAAKIERDHARELDLPDSSLVLPPNGDYRDPVSSADSDYKGRWIAGFAPVGNTGFVVIVQKRFEDVVGLDSSVLWNLAFWSVLITFLAIAVVGMVLWRWGHGQRRQPSFREDPGIS